MRLRDDVVHDLAGDVGQPEVATAVLVGQPLVVDPHEVEDRRVQVMDGINSYGKGDQLVQVNIYTPEKLSAEEKELLEKLKDAENFQPGNEEDKKGFFRRMREKL